MRVRFGPFVLDSGARTLVNAGRAVHLSPKAFDVLEILVARRPNVVSKEGLLREVWPGRIVEEANLAIAVGEIRKAIGEDPRSAGYILTVPRHGYRFGAEAGDLSGSAETLDTPEGYPRWWLTWGDKTLSLRQGENLVGRHPASSVWLNGTSVSRRHARIVADRSGVMIEDCASRNGTFVDGMKLVEPHLLVDGSTVTFGSEQVTFREWSDDAALATDPVRR